MFIEKILSILPTSLNYFRTVWEMTPKADQSIQILLERLQKELKRNEQLSSDIPSQNEVFKDECLSTKFCRKRNKKGHIEKYCRTFSLVSEDYHNNTKIKANIDSGASSHMFFNKDIINFIEKINVDIKCANAENLVDQAKGTVNTSYFQLEDVLYVPEVSRNLISVSSITDHDGSVLFAGNKDPM